MQEFRRVRRPGFRGFRGFRGSPRAGGPTGPRRKRSCLAQQPRRLPGKDKQKVAESLDMILCGAETQASGALGLARETEMFREPGDAPIVSNCAPLPRLRPTLYLRHLCELGTAGVRLGSEAPGSSLFPRIPRPSLPSPAKATTTSRRATGKDLGCWSLQGPRLQPL